MTIKNKVLIDSKLLESSQTTQYTTPGRTKAVIDKATVTNTSASAVNLSVNIVKVGDTASAADLIVDDRTIAAGETYGLPEMIGHVLEQGYFISTIAGTGSVLSLRVSGREIV